MNWREVLEKRLTIGTLRKTSYVAYISMGGLFEDWLKTKGVDFNQLIEEAGTDEGGDKACELINEFTNVHYKTAAYASKRTFQNMVSAIFRSCRRRLPSGQLVAQYTEDEEIERAAGEPMMTVDEFRRILNAADPGFRALLLCKYQGFMDSSKLSERFNFMWPAIREQVLAHQYPIRVWFSGGRKTNYHKYYCVLLKDAVEALHEYITKYRGEPKEGEPIWFKEKPRDGKLAPLDKDMLWYKFKTLVLSIGMCQKGDVNYHKLKPHELRDLAITEWNKAGVEMGLGLEKFAEFFAGHVIDRLNYNKMLSDWDWVLKHIRMIESRMNVISGEQERLSKLEAQRMIIEAQAKAQGLSVEEYVRKQMEAIGVKTSIVTEADLNEAIRILFSRPNPQRDGGESRPYETKILSTEEELKNHLDLGYDLVQEINGGKFVVRRKNTSSE